MRAEPRDDAEQVTQAVAGEPLWVEEERNGWLRVRTAYGYAGWVREASGGDAVAAARAGAAPWELQASGTVQP